MSSAENCRVVELRQYTMQPGGRDTLIELFEREFIETQQAVGLHVLGIFRDLERDDRFVWLRGFADMAARRRGLEDFYGGPVWAAHRDAANATMIDSSDVLLLRPVTALPAPQQAGRPWQMQIAAPGTACDADLMAALRQHGGHWLQTETAENDFPRLPVRAGASVIVGLAPGPVTFPAALHERLSAPVQTLHLQPTRRSPLQ